MLIYILLFLYLVFMFWLVNARKIKNEGWLLFSTFIVLFIIAGFRHYSVGSDTEVYKDIFESKMNLPSLSEYFDSRFELGFLYLNHFIYNYITTNYSIYLAIYSFLTLAITFFVTKKESRDAYFSLIIYYALGIYTGTMNTLRVSLAVSIIFLAYYFIKRNRNISAGISIIVASSFHLSALVFFLVYLFRKVRIGTGGLLIAGVISVLGFLGIRGIIENLLSVFSKYESYTQGNEYGDSAKLASILGSIIIILVFLWGEYVFRNITLKNSENFLRNIIILGVVFSIIAIQTVTIARIVAYFYNFIILYVPLIITKIPRKDFIERKQVMLIIITMIILFGFRFFVILIFRPEWNYIIPYRNTVIDFLFSF